MINMLTHATYHNECRSVFYQAVHEQPSGSTEDAVEGPRIVELLLLLLIYDSLHKQLEDKVTSVQCCDFLHTSDIKPTALD